MAETQGTRNRIEDITTYITSAAQTLSSASDGITAAITYVDYPHHEIHAGNHYFVSGSTQLTDTESIQFHVVTPNTSKYAHMRFDVQGTGEILFEVYEDTKAAITGGTTADVINNNRNSTNASVLTIVKDGATTSTGTLIESIIFGRQGVPTDKIGMGGSLGREDELILKKNSNYIFRVTSNSTGNNISYKGLWYEHTNL